ncbi:MAG: TolC family protein [Atribacterota bacterium]
MIPIGMVGAETILSDSQPLTITQVVEMVVQNDEGVRDARDNIEIARSENRLALNEKGFNPVVTVTGDVSLAGDYDSGISVGIKDSIALKKDTGKAWSSVKTTNLKVQEAERALETARENAKISAITQFLEVLKALKNKTLTEHSLSLAQTLLADMQLKVNQKMASNVDLLRAQQTVDNATSLLSQSERQVEYQSGQLNRLLERDLKSPLLLQEKFTYHPLNLDFSFLVSQALSRRSEFLDTTSQREIEKISLDDVKRDRQPKISLVGSYVEKDYSLDLSWGSPDWNLDWMVSAKLNNGGGFTLTSSQNSFSTSSTGWGVGLEITWIPFDGGISKEKIKQQEIKIAQLDRKINSLGDSVSLEVSDAYNSFLQADQAVLTAQMEQQIADQNYNLLQMQFEQGAITDRALADSKFTFRQDTVKYEKALFDYLLSKVRLMQVSGIPIRVEDI